MTQIIFIVFFLTSFFSVYAKELAVEIMTQEKSLNFHVVSSDIEHSGKNSSVSIVSDGKNKYILKQVRKNGLTDQVGLIYEAIISAVGCQHGIAVDKNSFVPHDVAEHLKVYKNKAATLHAFIEGESLSKVAPACIPKDFRLSQRFRPYQYEYKHGFEIEYGLNEVTLKSMACHKSLPGLVALDTFFGNFDRDTDNLIYNKEQDLVYGIDQGSAFSGDMPFLPLFASQQIIKLESLGYFSTCKPEIMSSLIVYKNMLHDICLYDEKDIMSALEQLIILLLPADKINSDKKDQYLKQLTYFVKESRAMCLKIVEQLESIFKQYPIKN
jgi:hypothetical protein